MSIGTPEQALEMSNLYGALEAAGKKEQQELDTPPDEKQLDASQLEDIASNQTHESDEAA